MRDLKIRNGGISDFPKETHQIYLEKMMLYLKAYFEFRHRSKTDTRGQV